MANLVKWDVGVNAQLIADAEPANNGIEVGSEVDGSIDLNMYADFELQVQHSTNPSAGGYYALYIVTAQDGTNYADGTDGTVVPPANALVGTFPVRAVTTAQRVALRRVILPPTKWKAVVINKSGQAASADSLQLYYRPYNEVIQ